MPLNTRQGIKRLKAPGVLSTRSMHKNSENPSRKIARTETRVYRRKSPPPLDLDDRAPLHKHEIARFPASRRGDTARRVYQAILMLTQGGDRRRYVAAIAAILGLHVRTVQLRMADLERWGVLKRKYHRLRYDWSGPSTYRFPLRERQLQLNFTLYRRIFKANTRSPKTPFHSMRKCGNARPGDHDPEFRAAWVRRVRANHPPELKKRYEERAAMWKHMRNWQPRRRPTDRQFVYGTPECEAYYANTVDQNLNEIIDILSSDETIPQTVVYVLKLRSPQREISTEARIAASASTACEQCDGKKRTILGGRIVDCWACSTDR